MESPSIPITPSRCARLMCRCSGSLSTVRQCSYLQEVVWRTEPGAQGCLMWALASYSDFTWGTEICTTQPQLFIHSLHDFQSADQVLCSRYSMAALQPALSPAV